VKPTPDTSYDPATSILPLRPAGKKIVRLPGTPGVAASATNVQKTRQLVLVEIAGPGGPLEVLVNNTGWMGKRRDAAMTPVFGSTFVAPNWLTEVPNEGDTEIWEIVNTTMDSHPIHLHAVQFQLINRQAFSMKGFMMAYAAAFPASTIIDPATGLPYAGGVFIPGFGSPLPYDGSDLRSGLDAFARPKLGGNPDVTPLLVGLALPPLAHEAGWKDTVIMHSGEVSRIVVRWGPQDAAVGSPANFAFQPDALVNPGGAVPQPGVYVWHCHITDHEDNEMVRPDMIVSNPSAPTRGFTQVTDY